ncbi:MAG: ABC transporter ATP-binding protein [Firmicutes bacterium]|nr:ABC transporter ATP-binding protein [Erysipelotrichaceae bacterium]MDD6525866.1 ABC transporter ATP-binding protein [Bacillota bacterium]MDD7227307.1 ABC transporter ATP-binding protein [Bacillota bacterium]MDY5997636.1 ABC transporter ATP-binding protein [Erysipelotrichaceae bacterium]
MLKIIDLHKSYGTKEVIKGLNLEVEDGKIYGFIGHNGSGKTTTIKAICGIHTFEKGDILINGLSIKDNDIECKKIMAYIPDNPDLYENMKAITYLNFIANIYQMDTNIAKRRIESLAKELEIYDNLSDQIKSLSHGMKQKVALISAFMHEPKLLVLDEPFVGLDPKASFILKNKMKELCDRGSSIFFSTHVLEVAEKLCDKVAILKDGVIMLEGDTDDILAQGKSLEELFLEM